MQTLTATMDSIQPHRIALKSRVVLQSPKGHMSSQYLCGMSRQDMSHNIYQVWIRDGNGDMQCVRAVIDSGAMTMFMVPRLQERFGLTDEQAYIITVRLDG